VFVDIYMCVVIVVAIAAYGHVCLPSRIGDVDLTQIIVNRNLTDSVIILDSARLT